jgi:hypothetical protein
MRALTQASEPVGIELDERDGVFVVTAVAPQSVAARSAQVAVGLVVREIDGSTPTSTTALALSGTVAGTKRITVQFARPRPQIPYYGCARKGIHKSVQYQMTDEQRKWLEKHVFVDGQRMYGIRDKGAFQAMKAAFHNRIRTDTMTPVWLEQSQIATWLVKQVKEEKDRRKVEKAEGRRGMEEPADEPAADEPLSKRSKASKGKGKAKHKWKSKAPPKGKGKAPAKRSTLAPDDPMEAEEESDGSPSDEVEESEESDADGE